MPIKPSVEALEREVPCYRSTWRVDTRGTRLLFHRSTKRGRGRDKVFIPAKERMMREVVGH